MALTSVRITTRLRSIEDDAALALAEEDQDDATKYWRRIFGDRFPAPKSTATSMLKTGDHDVASHFQSHPGCTVYAPGKVCVSVWWINDPERLSAERRAIDAISDDWFENSAWSLHGDCRLRLTFDIALPQRRFRLAMTYHNTFPASPPSVRPVDDAERISSHQYGPGGELCLSIRSDNWSPDVTGADMVRSAHTLLEVETPDEEGESFASSFRARRSP